MVRFKIALAILFFMVFTALVSNCAKAADFNSAIKHVLKHEGHLEYDKADPGGITNYGLSIRYLKDLVKHHPEAASLVDRDNYPGVDANDVMNMPLEDAIKVYRLYWWVPSQLDKVNNQPLADKIFDLSINMGAAQVQHLMDKAYVQLGRKDIYTYEKIDKLSGSDVAKLLHNFCFQADIFYRELAEKHPSYKKFLNGWLNRVWDGVKK